MSRSTTIVLIFILVTAIVVSGCINILKLKCGDPMHSSGDATLTKENPRLRVETPYASKDCHAQMYLTYRYVDTRLATANNKPPVIYEFGTINGVFPNPVSKPSPQDESAGGASGYIWVAKIDQGAKNAAEDSTKYHVTVALSPDAKDIPPDGIWVGIMIDYVPA